LKASTGSRLRRLQELLPFSHCFTLTGLVAMEKVGLDYI
jgi:hypothetical protein